MTFNSPRATWDHTSGCSDSTMFIEDASGSAIRVLKGELAGAAFKLDTTGKTEFTIGRHADNDICLGSVDKSISRRHAKISVGQSGEMLISDIGSKFGVIVNGKRLGPGESVRLNFNDKIEIGEMTILQFGSE